MAGTKARAPSIETVLGWLQAGFGQGTGTDYKPLLYVRDVPSQGTSSMVKSRVTKRVHHYLSRQEFKVHLLAEYSPHTIEIREQYALLPWEETQEIASAYGIRHPIYRGTNTPTVFTTDLLITKKRSTGRELCAISVKLEKDLTPRNFEKLFIEKMYWARRGVQWILATDMNIPEIKTDNLAFFESALNHIPKMIDSEKPELFSRVFESNYSPRLSFNEIMEKATTELDIDTPTGHALLGQSVWNRSSRINIDKYLITHRAPVLLNQ